MTEETQTESGTRGAIAHLQGRITKTAEHLEQLLQTIRNPTEVTAEYCGRAMGDLRQLKEDAEDLAKAIDAQYRFYREVVMVRRMQELGENTTKFAVKGYGTFTLVPDFHISIKGDQKEEAKLWLTENGMGDLITETVNASSLKAASKKYLEANGVFPSDEHFRSHSFEYVKLTKR